MIADRHDVRLRVGTAARQMSFERSEDSFVLWVLPFHHVASGK